jgi:hypothetical protein
MRNPRIWTESLALVFLAGCGVFGGVDESAPEDAPILAPNDSPAPAPALTGTPAPSDLDETLGVFVAPDGSPTAAGTRALPVSTIAKGVEIAKKSGKRVYVCEGTYREAIVIEDGISMVGGLDCSSPTWAIGNGRSRVESPSSPAITAKGISKTTRFERFDVIAPDASEPSGSSIALFATDAASLTIATSRIEAGNGANGEDGAPAVQLVQTGNVDGTAGRGAIDYCFDKRGFNCAANPTPYPGGNGGTSICSGAAGFDGEGGGKGGTGGIYESMPPSGAHLTVYWEAFDFNPTYLARSGEQRTGGVAANGSDGASAAGQGSFSKEGFVPKHGTRGTNGSPGKAGSGGNGAAPAVSAENQNVWYGNSGSGGGAGGCPGLAGGEGKGGGASIAAYLVDSAMTFDGVELLAKNGGNGGKGTFGSKPTAGGAGGPLVNNIAGTSAKPGTAGGDAGSSGSGAGGSSLGIVHTGGAPNLVGTTPKAGKAGSGVAAQSAYGKTIPASASGVANDVMGWDVVP